MHYELRYNLKPVKYATNYSALKHIPSHPPHLPHAAQMFARDASGQTPVLVAAANRNDAVMHVLNNQASIQYFLGTSFRRHHH